MSNLKLPPSSTAVTVSIIDTTSWLLDFPCAHLFSPRFPGLEKIDICAYGFLITHPDGRQVVFDLGIRKDWENLVPATVQKIKGWGSRLEIKQDTADILTEHGVDLNKLDAVIWSHLHWDHTGNLAKFPSQVKLVVGPGVTKASMPGYPTNTKSEFNESDVAGRDVVEIDKSKFQADVGGVPGFDYFGDGSFYLLDAPGHSVGHMNALVKTSITPDTYMLLAADSIHLGGEFRPSEHLPLPDSVDVSGLVPCPCPGEALLAMHPQESRTTPFLGLDASFPDDLTEANETIGWVQKFDADDRILTVFAHDLSIYKVLEYFPKTANDWKRKGWKEKGQWAFLTDLQKWARAAGQKLPEKA